MKPKSPDAQSIDEMHKMSTLFNRASSSSSNREKNQLLTQLRTMALDYLSKYEKVVTRNSISEKELLSLHKNYENLKTKLDITKMHVDQQEELRHRGSISNNDDIINKIKQYEEELQTFGPFERPELLSNAKNAPFEDNLKSILLWDIQTQRLEELIYALQKRIITVEENQERSQQIIDEFGSVFGLIDVYKSLSIENQKLKKEEAQFFGDSVVRRRNNSLISVFTVRQLIKILQKEFAFQNDLLSSLETTNQIDIFKSSSTDKFTKNRPKPVRNMYKTRSDAVLTSTEKLVQSPFVNIIYEDFDNVCNDEEFKMTTAVTMMPTGALDASVTKTLPINEAIQETEKNITLAKTQLLKIEEDVSNARQYKFPTDKTMGNRVIKLIELTQKLFDQIEECHKKIDAANIQIDKDLKQFEVLLVNKYNYQRKAASVFDPYKSLLYDYHLLNKEYSHNVQIDKSLASVSSLLVRDSISEDPKIHPLFFYFQPLFLDAEATLRSHKEKLLQIEKEKAKEKEKEKEPLVSWKSSRGKPKFSFQRWMASPVISQSQTPKEMISPATSNMASSRVETNIETSNSSSLSSSRKVEPKRVKKEEKIFTTNLLTILAELCGPLFGKHNKSHTFFRETWNRIHVDLKNQMNDTLSMYDMGQRNLISTVQLCSNKILVKNYKNISTMTLPEQRIDMETQYEKPEKKAKTTKKK